MVGQGARFRRLSASWRCKEISNRPVRLLIFRYLKEDRLTTPLCIRVRSINRIESCYKEREREREREMLERESERC